MRVHACTGCVCGGRTGVMNESAKKKFPLTPSTPVRLWSPTQPQCMRCPPTSYSCMQRAFTPPHTHIYTFRAPHTLSAYFAVAGARLFTPIICAPLHVTHMLAYPAVAAVVDTHVAELHDAAVVHLLAKEPICVQGAGEGGGQGEGSSTPRQRTYMRAGRGGGVRQGAGRVPKALGCRACRVQGVGHDTC